MEAITLEDMLEEIEDMLSVCFEGRIVRENAQIRMILPGGQRFSVSVDEEAA